MVKRGAASDRKACVPASVLEGFLRSLPSFFMPRGSLLEAILALEGWSRPGRSRVARLSTKGVKQVVYAPLDSEKNERLRF